MHIRLLHIILTSIILVHILLAQDKDFTFDHDNECYVRMCVVSEGDIRWPLPPLPPPPPPKPKAETAASAVVQVSPAEKKYAETATQAKVITTCPNRHHISSV